MPDDAPVLLPHMGFVVGPILVELFLHKGTVLIVREMGLDGVEGVFQKVRVALFARGQVEVNQIGRGVVADRVPVLLAAIRPQGLAARVQGNRVQVREVAAQLPIQEEAVEEVHRHLGVLQDARVARHAVGLDRPGEGIDLLIGRDGVKVVAELGSKDFVLAVSVHVNAVVPVDHLFIRIVETHMLAQVFGALLGPFEEAVFASHQIG